MPKLIYARPLHPREYDELVRMAAGPNPILAKRARIILLSSRDRYRVPEIASAVGLGADKVRKWIHRFNEQGIEGLRTRPFKPGPPPKYQEATRQKILEIARTPPRQLGLLFSRWTLHTLRQYLIEHGIVEEISHETLRKILRRADVDWRRRRLPGQGLNDPGLTAL